MSSWPPREWRIFAALLLLAVAGGGAWLLSKWSLDALVMLSAALGTVWPLAYFAYAALGVLAIPSLGFAVVIGLKSFIFDGPGDTSVKIEGNDQ